MRMQRKFVNCARRKGTFSLHKSSITLTDYSFSKRDGWKLSSWAAPTYLTKALERRYGGPQGGYPQKFADWSERQRLGKEAKILSTMYNWLEYLAGQSRTFGALGIAEAVLFLWKEHFEKNPLYEQVTTLLLFRGSEQQGWFPTANHKLPVEEELSKLQISSSEFSCWRAVALNSPEIFEVNKRAIIRISNALLTLEEGEEVVKTNQLHTFSVAACNEIADLIKTQNSLVDECIRTSPLTQLYSALKVWELATQCGILAEIIKSEKYFSDEPKEKKHEDLTLLLVYLRQLISAV
jgi:hypothetical protein